MDERRVAVQSRRRRRSQDGSHQPKGHPLSDPSQYHSVPGTKRGSREHLSQSKSSKQMRSCAEREQ